MSLAASIKCLRRFQRDESGNFAMLFGLSIVPLLGLTGAAVDYSRASKARAELSAAIDSAALMAARDASKLTDAELTTRINNWIKNNLSPETAARFGTASIAIDRVNRTVNISGNIDVDTSIARVLGQNTHRRQQRQPVLLGHQEDRARPGARQYRLDGGREAHRPEDRDA